MRLERTKRSAAAGLLVAVSASLTGCQNHCCRVYNDPCAPAPAPVVRSGGVYRYGDACAAAPGTGSSPTIIADSPAPRQVVVSEPGRRSSKGWNKVDPESAAITKVDGAVSTDSLKR